MTYSGELVMPTSYVEVAEEEMTYLDGGFCMARGTAQKILDGVIFLATWYISGLSSVKTLINKVGKTKAVSFVAKGLLKIGISAATASKVAGFIGTITGWSIGGGLAYLCDRYDKDGVSGKIKF